MDGYQPFGRAWNGCLSYFTLVFLNCETARRSKILRRVGAHRASRKGKARNILLRLAVSSQLSLHHFDKNIVRDVGSAFAELFHFFFSFFLLLPELHFSSYVSAVQITGKEKIDRKSTRL